MQVGDRIRSIGGIPVEDMKSMMSQPRAAIGEVRPYEVERAGEVTTLNVEHAAQPAGLMLVSRVATLLGLCFIGFTLWAYLTAPGAATSVLAGFGMSFGLAFVGIPYISSFTLRTLADTLITIIIFTGFALLLHFLLLFNRRNELDAPPSNLVVYGPAAIVALFFAGLSLFLPAATSGLNQFIRLLIGVFIIGYFVASIVVLVRAYGRATANERTESGLGLMVMGAVIGLLPLLVSSLLRTIAPRIVLPGGQYYFLTLGLIPITFSLAAVRRARAGRGVPAMADSAVMGSRR
jgi:hypothetical protein